MNTCTLSLPRPWWRRATDALREVLARARERQALRDRIGAAHRLDEATLRDIGAPPWLLDEARRVREQCRFERELQRLAPEAASRRYF